MAPSLQMLVRLIKGRLSSEGGKSHSGGGDHARYHSKRRYISLAMTFGSGDIYCCKIRIWKYINLTLYAPHILPYVRQRHDQ